MWTRIQRGARRPGWETLVCHFTKKNKKTSTLFLRITVNIVSEIGRKGFYRISKRERRDSEGGSACANLSPDLGPYQQCRAQTTFFDIHIDEKSDIENDINKNTFFLRSTLRT